MEREYVDSSMIASIGYDASTSTLEIEFKSNGEVWQYYDFPESAYYELKSGSIGKFFNANIRGKFRESKV